MMKRMSVLPYWKSLLVTMVILLLSFAPSSAFHSVPVVPHADKLVHAAMYFGLTVVLLHEYVCRHREFRFRFRIVLLCLLYPAVLGGGVEIMQGLFFKPRTADWFDWLADVAGVLLAWILVCGWRRRMKDITCSPEKQHHR